MAYSLVFVALACLMGASSSPGAPLMIQLPANDLRNSVGWPEVFGLCIRLGDLEEAHGSQLQISPALAVLAIWGENQYIEGIFLSLLCNSDL